MAEIKLTQGQRIRYARESAGLKQVELAASLRVSRAALSAWEGDENRRGVPYAQLRLIAELTGFDADFFTPGEVSFAAVTSSESLGQPYAEASNQLRLFDARPIRSFDNRLLPVAQALLAA
jgi:transcriptional regulator with XRE-family HTH domain